MTPFHVAAHILAAIFILPTGFPPAFAQPPAPKPPITIVTDPGWDVGGGRVQFGEYPLSAEQIAAATATLPGGTQQAAVAKYSQRAKVIAGTTPIWRNRTADSEGEAYLFRKTVHLGPDPIRKATLEINCDDVARVYINQRLVSADKRDGSIKDGYDKRYLFRSVSGFLDDRVYTYDVTDYFFTHVANTILVEVVSLAFDGNHAYLSAKIVIEFGPMPAPPRPAPAPRKPAAAPKAKPPAPAAPAAPAVPEKTVFEAGRDPGIDKLHVGSVLELGNVYFKANDYRLDTASYRTLDALAAFLKRHPSLKIEVGGHTNLRPTDAIAAELSTNRARTVMRYLTDNGVAPERLTYKGYGKSQPRVRARTQEADRANQRVEVKVLER